VEGAPDPGPPPVAPSGAEGAADRFPCPKCGAGLLYDPKARGLRCPFCGEQKALEAAGDVAEKDLDEALREAARTHEARPAAAADRTVACEACGASVQVPATETAGRCAYCGSTRVLPATPDPSRIPPECLVPFAVDRVQAETLFRTWIRSLWFRPNALKGGSALADMRGMLVPFWTFDAHAESDWTAQAGHYYYVTVGSGNNRRTERRVRWESASGHRRDFHDDVLVCASRGLDAGLVGEIDPFDLKALVAFREEYLAGWAAEAYAVDVREGWGTAERLIRNAQEVRCSGDVPGDTQRDLSVRTTLSGKRYRHALLPVWVCAYRFRGKAFRFLVNGQTGEVQGYAPWSWVKIGLLVLGVAATITGIVLLAGR
jgi:DNA-directed RNA polymerase subunit RPC12/RpoP